MTTAYKGVGMENTSKIQNKVKQMLFLRKLRLLYGPKIGASNYSRIVKGRVEYVQLDRICFHSHKMARLVIEGV